MVLVAELLSLCPARHPWGMYARDTLMAAAQGFKVGGFIGLWKECMGGHGRAWTGMGVHGRDLG